MACFQKRMPMWSFAMILMMALVSTSAAMGDPAWGMKAKNMTVYMHDVTSGVNRTAIKVAGANGTASSPFSFGTIIAIDDLLTSGPDKNTSQTLGRAQGLYTNVALDSSQTNLQLMFSMIFTTAQYNGSTLQIQGADRLYLTYRDVSIVGGTGAFRFATGYATVSSTNPELIKFDLHFRHY